MNDLRGADTLAERPDLSLACVDRSAAQAWNGVESGSAPPEPTDHLVVRLITGPSGLNAMTYAAFSRHDRLVVAIPPAVIGGWHRRVAALPPLDRASCTRHLPDGAAVPAEEHLAAILLELGQRASTQEGSVDLGLRPLIAAVNTARPWLVGLFLAVRMLELAFAQPRGSQTARWALRWATALATLSQRLDGTETVTRLAGGDDPLIRLDVNMRPRATLTAGTPSPETRRTSPSSAQEAVVRGRVLRIRRHRTVTFVDIASTDRIVGLRLDHANPARPDRLIDKGDWVAAATPVDVPSRQGEPVEPLRWVEHHPTVLGKAQRPVPLPPPQLVQIQSAVLGEITRFLHDHGFLQCVSPVLTDSFYGGASTPFLTFTQSGRAVKALRVTSELALKSVIAAGHPRCFEIGPMFRNESEDRRHLNSFTMLEYYAREIDVVAMTELTVDLVAECVRAVSGESPPVGSATAAELIADALGVAIDSGTGMSALAERLKVDGPVGERTAAALIGQALITTVMPRHPELLIIEGLPAGASPLIKREGDKALRRWISYGGTFLADVAQEETDVAAVAAALRAQFAVDRYPVRRDYRNFLSLLAAGMPPLSGVGMGVSPLIAILAGLEDVRDGVLDHWQG